MGFVLSKQRLTTRKISVLNDSVSNVVSLRCYFAALLLIIWHDIDVIWTKKRDKISLIRRITFQDICAGVPAH